MKKISIILTICANIICLSANTQTIKRLKVGDRVPEVLIQHILNYPSSKLVISDLKGKLVILDFWSVHCSSCIKEMPEMQAYQEKFKDQVQVLLVTTDSREEIQNLYSRSKLFAGIRLPIVYEDQVLSKMFPYTAYGLHVWVDKQGIVRYRTNSGSYTEADISSFLKGNMLSLTARNDTTKFDKDVPLWMEGNGRQIKHIKYYSYIADDLPDYAGSGGALITDSIHHQPIGVKFINTSILTLYIMAYQEWGKKTFDSIGYEIKDTSKYFPPEDGDVYEWVRENGVSYELHLPPSKSGEFFSVMRQDLERYFDLKGETDTLGESFYILSFDSTLYKNASKYFAVKGAEPIKSYSMPFHKFLCTLRKLENTKIEVNPDYNFPENIEMPAFTSKPELFAFLNKAGFKLTKQFRTIRLLKLKENL